MLTIHIHLAVKFRAFGVTFGKLEKQEVVPTGIPIPFAFADRVIFAMNERGVFLKVQAKKL